MSAKSAKLDADPLPSALAAATAPHPVVTRPALLSHLFRFAVRKHKDVKLLYVHSSWEDTAVNYSPWIWRRLIDVRGLSSQVELPAQPATAVEAYSQYLFNRYILCVWIRLSGDAIVTRLVEPEIISLINCSMLKDAGLSRICCSFSASLRELNVSFCAELTDSAFAHVGNLAQLTSLNVSGCWQLGDAVLAGVGKLPKLRELVIGGLKRMTDAGVAHLENEALEFLTASRCELLNDTALAHIGSKLTNLRVLDLACCVEISNAGLLSVGALNQLEVLDVAYCKKLTDLGLGFLEDRLPALRSLRIDGVPLSDDAKARFKRVHPKCALIC